MTFEERAQIIWATIEGNLEDRECFNGIDDVMEELAKAQIAIIIENMSDQ